MCVCVGWSERRRRTRRKKKGTSLSKSLSSEHANFSFALHALRLYNTKTTWWWRAWFFSPTLLQEWERKKERCCNKSSSKGRSFFRSLIFSVFNFRINRWVMVDWKFKKRRLRQSIKRHLSPIWLTCRPRWRIWAISLCLVFSIRILIIDIVFWCVGSWKSLTQCNFWWMYVNGQDDRRRCEKDEVENNLSSSSSFSYLFFSAFAPPSSYRIVCALLCVPAWMVLECCYIKQVLRCCAGVRARVGVICLFVYKQHSRTKKPSGRVSSTPFNR